MPLSRRAIALAVAFVAVAALGGFTFLQMRSADAADGGADDSTAVALRIAGAEEGAASAAIAIPVEGAAVVRDTLVVSVTATGQAAALRQVILAAHVAGRVAQLPVRESDRVAGGGLVVGLDAEEYALALEEAQAGQRASDAAFREKTLFDDRITDADLRAERTRTARATSGLERAELGVRKAELDLHRTRVAAPFAGQVANVRVVPGQFVRAGDELATVVELDPVRIEVQVLEREVAFLASGRQARVTLAAFPGETFTGTIRTINPVVDSTTRTARVTVQLPNAARRILPGMYARVSLDARRFPDRVLVPRSAVLERDVDRRTLVFVLEDGVARWRYVTTGLGNATHVEIVDDPDTPGVQPGETVLVDGHHTLTDGARVRLVERVAGEEGRQP